MGLFGKKKGDGAAGGVQEAAAADGRIVITENADLAEVVPQENDFAARVRSFRDWFSENEAHIAEMAAQGGDIDPDAFVAFLSEGVGRISDRLYFNIGGDNEFTFAVSGDEYLHFLLPYIVEQMPEALQGKWHFFAGMPGTHGQSFGLRMNGADASADEVFVSMTVPKDAHKADLRFYSEKLKDLEDNQAYGFFFIMMDNIVGEALSFTCVGGVDRAAGMEAGMIPLNELEAKLRAGLWTQEGDPNPAHNYFVYQLEAKGDTPRSDVFIGRNCYAGILNAYMDGEPWAFDAFAGCGAQPVFLCYETDTKRADPLGERNAVEDELAETVLNEEAKDRAGLVLGAAMGRQFAYIDFLVYDAAAFLAGLKTVLAGYPGVKFYLAEFKRGGKIAEM
ncbi:MAG: hypothetical protein FWF33_04765 [Clostridiales bacterium]|nr:hypothetical protein [Clostridiales bacterium]